MVRETTVSVPRHNLDLDKWLKTNEQVAVIISVLLCSHIFIITVF